MIQLQLIKFIIHILSFLKSDQHTMIIYQLIFYDMKALYKDKIQNKDVAHSIYLMMFFF